MACGDRFKYLAKTTSGLTLDSPGTILPATPMGQQIYSEWYDLARRLSAQANAKMNELGAIEETQGNYPKWNMLVSMNNDMTEAYEGLSNPALVFDYAGARDEAMAVVRQALCLYEQSSDAIASYSPTTKTQHKVPMWVWIVGPLLGVGIIVASAVTIRSRRGQQAQRGQQIAA